MAISFPISRFIDFAMSAKEYASEGFELSEKVYKLALPWILTSSGVYYCGIGAGELLYNEKAHNEIDVARKTTGNPFKRMHGYMYVGTGVVESMEAFLAFTKKSVAHCFSWLRHFGHTCFFFANLIELHRNLLAYERGEGGFSSQAKEIAMMGILSNLGYMVGLALALFDSTMTLACILMFLAALLSGIKFVSIILLSEAVKK